MVRVRFPMRRLAPARDHHAGAMASLVGARLHSCRQMHCEGHGTKHTLGVMDQADELAKVSLAPKIEDAAQRPMLVP